MMFANHRFLVAAYLVFAAMVFDALDGRLARFTRHTTDFGGQLDSLADVVSFGIAPAIPKASNANGAAITAMNGSRRTVRLIAAGALQN